ncbi:ParB/RepB/Spo0J family partition protein [Streptomyces scopuliridis]|uniref:ParB/RepB/Spo0J family partition protein n=1 Tax=Streptomyces scopuliridis TaxID=452529 RepID=UPI003440829B
MAYDPNGFDDFLDDEGTENIVDTKADGRLLRVPLKRISPNYVNPRTDFGSQEQLEDLGRSLRRRQIHAVPVVTRKAYLKLWPEHKERVGSVDVVIVSGERRYRGAGTVDLPALECVINDDVAVDKKTFLDAVVSENIDRQNFDPVEEAYAVEALVAAFETGRAVAQHYQRVDGWVTQRRILLHLAPAVLPLVRRREIPLEFARKLGKLTKDHGWDEEQQLDWWSKEQQERKAVAEKKKVARKEKEVARKESTAAKDGPEEGVKTSPSPKEEPASSSKPSKPSEAAQDPSATSPGAEGTEALSSGGETPASPDLTGSSSEGKDASRGRPPLPDVVTVGAVPWGDPASVKATARHWMKPDNWEVFRKLVSEDD